MRNGDIRPVYCGSATQVTGIERLLDLIREYFPRYAEKGMIEALDPDVYKRQVLYDARDHPGQYDDRLGNGNSHVGLCRRAGPGHCADQCFFLLFDEKIMKSHAKPEFFQVFYV